jgi:hypothetical protein
MIASRTIDVKRVRTETSDVNHVTLFNNAGTSLIPRSVLESAVQSGDRPPPVGDGAAAGLVKPLAFQHQTQVDLRTAAPWRLDHKVKMRPGPMAAMNGGEDPFTPLRLARGGAAASRDQFQRIGGSA